MTVFNAEQKVLDDIEQLTLRFFGLLLHSRRADTNRIWTYLRNALDEGSHLLNFVLSENGHSEHSCGDIGMQAADLGIFIRQESTSRTLTAFGNRLVELAISLIVPDNRRPIQVAVETPIAPAQVAYDLNLHVTPLPPEVASCEWLAAQRRTDNPRKRKFEDRL